MIASYNYVCYNEGGNRLKNKRIHRKYKDRVFRIIFRDKKELPELYNVVNDSAYTNPD